MITDQYKCANIRVHTPDGAMFVNIMEDKDGEPFQILINVGKAGSSVAAWAYGFAELISLLLRSGKKLEEVITMLSGITSSGRARTISSRCTSGPEGVWMALLKYKKLRFQELVATLGDDLEEEDEQHTASTSRR